MDLLFDQPKSPFCPEQQLDHLLVPSIKPNTGNTCNWSVAERVLVQLLTLIAQPLSQLFPPTPDLVNYTYNQSDVSVNCSTDIIAGTQPDLLLNDPVGKEPIILPVYKDSLTGDIQNISLVETKDTTNNEITNLTTEVPLANPTSNNNMLFGIYYGNEGTNVEQIEALESWQGNKNAVVNLFTDWTNNSTTIDKLFNQQLPNIWNNQNVPLITWEPFTDSTTPNEIEVRIANGEYDTYIDTWADNMKTFLSGTDAVYGTTDDRRAYLRFAHEMNGNWYPWSAAVGNNSPTNYINMWQHVKGIFDSKGMDATRLQWVWNVNNTDVGGFSAERFYPGDAYVDWIAIDGYNWGTSESLFAWTTPAQTYGAMIGRLQMITNKPLAITEFASTTSGGEVTGKSQWIDDALNYFATQNVKMVISFNKDKETDWAMFGGINGDTTYEFGGKTYKAYQSYQRAIASSNIIPSNPTNPRLLTDAQFAGLI